MVAKPTLSDPSPRLDGCPSCAARDNSPCATERPSSQAVVCHYVCRKCGQDWQTSWWEGDE